MRLDINDYIDSDKAESILNITLGDRIVSSESIAKSFYQFDFESEEGITTFLSLLSVLDKEVVQQAQEQLLPGSIDERWDLIRARFELKGFLIDLLESGNLTPADPLQEDTEMVEDDE